MLPPPPIYKQPPHTHIHRLPPPFSVSHTTRKAASRNAPLQPPPNSTPMGQCFSNAAASAVRSDGLSASTAMVLLPTGELREYPRPATAALALEDSVSSSADAAHLFLCDADKIGFEGPVASVSGNEELRPGQIYFVLPAEAKRNGLRREEVAALAVRASAALVNKAAAANSNSGSGRWRRARSVAPLVFAPPQEEEAFSYKAAPAPAKSAGRMQQRFAPDLSAIPECDTSE